MNASNSSIAPHILLKQLNDEKTTLLIPVIVYVSLLMFVGLTGNGFVLFFYGCKTKLAPATIFIQCLAVFDLISCAVAMPMEITDIFYFFTFENVPACKVMRFVNHFASIASSLTLVAIAVDRYKRICKPFGKQLSIKHSRIVCCACAGLGLFFATPAAVYNTVVPVNITNTYNMELTGYDCTTTDDDAYEPYLFAYSTVLGVGFVIIVIVLGVMYFFIGRQLFRHKKFKFYVASKRARRRTTSGQNFTSNSEDHDISVTQTAAAGNNTMIEETAIDDPLDVPPEPTSPVDDLREFVTQGIPGVCSDRPQSAVTDMTDLSVRTRKSVQSTKSIEVLDVTQLKQQQEERRQARPDSARSDSSWATSITRSGSPDSISYISARPSSNATSHRKDFRYRKGTVGSRDTCTNNINRPSSASSTASRASLGSRTNTVAPETTTKTSSTGNDISKVDSLVDIDDDFHNDRGKVDNSLMHTTGSRSEVQPTKVNTDTDDVKDLRMKLLDINTIKYTLIMLIITVIFVLSFLPYLVLETWRNFFPSSDWEMFTDAEYVAFSFGMKSYFLNSALNPLIYGLFNSHFRTFFSQLFCGCCISKSKKEKKKRTKETKSTEKSTSFSDS